MTDPLAYAGHLTALAPQWALIQSLVRETSRYALRQNDLGLAACQNALRSGSMAALATIEFEFVTNSLRLALDTAGRVAHIGMPLEDETVDCLPIE